MTRFHLRHSHHAGSGLLETKFKIRNRQKSHCEVPPQLLVAQRRKKKGGNFFTHGTQDLKAEEIEIDTVDFFFSKKEKRKKKKKKKNNRKQNNDSISQYKTMLWNPISFETLCIFCFFL